MFKKVSLSILILCIISCFLGNGSLVPPFSAVSDQKKTGLKSSGSTSMSHIISILSNEFISMYPEYSYEKSESGSGAAPSLVKNKSSDLGDMSRNLAENENNPNFDFIYIALDGIAVILNNENKNFNLSKKQLQDIFSKKITDWSQISNKFCGPVVTIGREEGSGTKNGFESGIELSDAEYDLIFSESGDILSKVMNETNAIGYISLASVSSKIHAISIDNIECNLQNIKDKSYPIIRPFLQIYNKNIKNEVLDKWTEFLKTDRAKELIEKERLVYVY